MKPVAQIVFDARYDSSMTLVSKSRPQIFKTNVDLMEFEPDTYLYAACPVDQLREAQVKVLREAAFGCRLESDAGMIRRMIAALEKQT